MHIILSVAITVLDVDIEGGKIKLLSAQSALPSEQICQASANMVFQFPICKLLSHKMEIMNVHLEIGER